MMDEATRQVGTLPADRAFVVQVRQKRSSSLSGSLIVGAMGGRLREGRITHSKFHFYSFRATNQEGAGRTQPTKGGVLMDGVMSKALVRWVSVGLLVLGLAGPALGQAPPPAGPVEDLQATLGIILDRLDDLEGKIDNQSTDLRGVTQNWDKKLDSTNGDANGCNSDRFTCLFGDTVVRDNETGNVWDRDPDTNDRIWTRAISHCANREVGGRKGWSLPMREQLATLVDTSNSDPALPTGHPFLNVQSALYWSASTNANGPAFAWSVNFVNGFVSFFTKGSSRLAWCVRGGQAYDGQGVQEVIDALP